MRSPTTGPGSRRGRTGSGACRWILGNAAPGSPHVGGEKASDAPGSGHVCGNGSPQAPNATDMTRSRCASRPAGTDMPPIRCGPQRNPQTCRPFGAAVMPEGRGTRRQFLLSFRQVRRTTTGTWEEAFPSRAAEAWPRPFRKNAQVCRHNRSGRVAHPDVERKPQVSGLRFSRLPGRRSFDGILVDFLLRRPPGRDGSRPRR